MDAPTEVTDQVDLERVRRRSRDRFQQMADDLPLIVWVYDAQDRLKMVNRAYCEYFGVTPEQVRGDQWQLLVHPDDAPAHTHAYQESLQTRTPFHGEVRVCRGDGQWRWMETRSVPRFGSDGAYLGRIGTGADVTDRKRAEQALVASEERFRTMVDGLPLIVWVHDVQEQREAVNQAYLDFFGLTAEQIHERPWQSLLHPEDASDYGVRHALAIRERRPFRGEARVRRGDGQWRWMETWSVPRLASDGSYLGRLGTSADITDRRDAEQALRESEQRFRVMADGLPLIVWLHDAAGHQEFVNETFCDFFGVTREEMRGGRWQMLIHPDDTEAYARRFQECTRERREFHAEARVQRADGQWRWMESWSKPRFTPEGTYLGQVGTSVDVTERRTAQDREREVSLRLQRALLPGTLVAHPAVQIAARYAASSTMLEVGGDWYDTYALPQGQIGISVGDVVGHGLDAAAAMGRLRTALAALAPLAGSPENMLSGLDEFVQGPNGVEYATACCAILDPATGELRYASAGHPPMLVVLPDGRHQWLTGGHTIALCRVDAVHRSRTQSGVRLEPGALLVAYSDGLVERRRASLTAGLRRLQEVVVHHRNDVCEDVCEAILDQMTGGSSSEDDIVLVCLRYTPE